MLLCQVIVGCELCLGIQLALLEEPYDRLPSTAALAVAVGSYSCERLLVNDGESAAFPSSKVTVRAENNSFDIECDYVEAAEQDSLDFRSSIHDSVHATIDYSDIGLLQRPRVSNFLSSSFSGRLGKAIGLAVQDYEVGVADSCAGRSEIWNERVWEVLVYRFEKGFLIWIMEFSGGVPGGVAYVVELTSGVIADRIPM